MQPSPEVLAHLRALQHHVRELEISAGAAPSTARADIVQLKPSAHPRWGGLLLRVTRSTPHTVEGYLLLPHRGGSRESWRKFTPGEVTEVGKLEWPEAPYGFQRHGACLPEACRCPTGHTPCHMMQLALHAERRRRP